MEYLPTKWHKVWEAPQSPIFETYIASIASQAWQRQFFNQADHHFFIMNGSDNKAHAYHTWLDLKKNKENGYTFFRDKKQREDFFAQAEAIIKESKEIFAKLDKSHLPDAQKEQIGTILNNLSTHQAKLFAVFNMTNPQFTSALEEELYFAIQKKDLENTAQLLRLITQKNQSTSNEERELAWLELLKQAAPEFTNTDPVIVDDVYLKERVPAVYDLLVQHKHAYAGYYDEAHCLTLLSFIEKLRAYLHNPFDINEAIDEHTQKYNRIQNERKDTIRFLNDDAITKRAELLAQINYYRFELAFTWQAGFKYLHHVLDMLAAKSGVSYEAMLQFTTPEILAIVDGRAELVPVEVQNRKEAYLFLHQESDYELFTGIIADRKFNKLFDNEHPSHFKGQTLLAGNVQGVPYILNWGEPDFRHKIMNVPAGAIVVIDQIKEHFIPYLKESAGVIIDESLNNQKVIDIIKQASIPCIMDTQHGTMYCHPDWEIQIDGQQGIVRQFMAETPEDDINPPIEGRRRIWQIFKRS